MTKKYCPGLIYLRAKLRAMIAESQADQIRVYDGEDVQNFATDEVGVLAASEYCTDLDGQVYYSVGKLTVCVIYDGPYHEGNAEEIISDANGAMMDFEEGKGYPS